MIEVGKLTPQNNNVFISLLFCGSFPVSLIDDNVAPLDLLKVSAVLHHHLVVGQQHVEDNLAVLREALVGSANR